ncbi:MAG: mannose-1-phosphate guanylyltransferase [Verrucomicrobiales bacterium]|jgi:mannose-1-phosphate guanylyltransferase
MSHQTYALILAGGSGERFWPLSRKTLPKQLLKLFSEKSLLQETVDRISGVLPLENILILTNTQQFAATCAELPDFPTENILAEPEKRDTAPAIALAVGWVAARDPQASMIVLPADQLIQQEDEFHKIIRAAAHAAQLTDAIITIGIKPTWACPSYGYIERGAETKLEGLDDAIDIYEVERFREKPEAKLAEHFLEAGNYSWNAGMFIWSVPTVIKELTQHTPQLVDFIEKVKVAEDLPAMLVEEFPKLEKISIDYALMEKASRVLNIEASFDWDDVGGWVSVAKYIDQDDKENSANTTVTNIDSSDNIVFTKGAKQGPHVALLGVHNLIIVQTDDAILVADRDRADEIKKLMPELPDELL